MEKVNKIIALVFLICLLPSTALAASYSVYTDTVEVDQEMTVAPIGGIATASDDGAAAYTVNYTVYDDGMIADQYANYARGLLQYVKPNEDYVFARTGQYEYIFAHGDWDGDFSGEATIYEITIANYNTAYSYDTFTDSNFNLSVGSGLVYSSIAPYPSLTGSDFTYGINLFLAFALCLIFCCWMIKHAFLSFGVRL